LATLVCADVSLDASGTALDSFYYLKNVVRAEVKREEDSFHIDICGKLSKEDGSIVFELRRNHWFTQSSTASRSKFEVLNIHTKTLADSIVYCVL
jgi:hypothetical protein